MKNLMLFLVLGLVSISTWARPISSLPGFSWEVVPTNPQCEAVEGLPRDAWCRKSDLAKNLLRQDTPEFKLLPGIRDPETTHIRMTYLSFGNERVAKGLCEALQRGVTVELVLDSSKAYPIEQELKACNPEKFSFYSRGNAGGIGFAHNKVTFFTKKSSSDMEIVIGSGNLTTGTILTHENWHFIRAPKTSYFVSMHECLWEGVKNHAETDDAYADFLNVCRQKIATAPEKGIEIFFIPGGGQSLIERLRTELQSSEWVFGASHRFNGGLVKNLLSGTLSAGIKVGMVFDDDLYWAGVLRKGFGLNQYSEARVVRDLVKQGMQVKYIQTNQKEHLINHNKFFIWGKSGRTEGAFFGAGNLTDSAFTKNFENFYLVTLPEVVEEMQRYQQHLWNDLATQPEGMPQNPL